MPNQPKTPAKSYRIPEDLLALMAEKRALDGGTDTDIVVAALRAYLSPEEGVSYT